MLLEKNELKIYKECLECGEKEFVKIPEYTKEKTVKLEHSFNYDIYNEEINENGLLEVANMNEYSEISINESLIKAYKFICLNDLIILQKTKKSYSYGLKHLIEKIIFIITMNLLFYLKI